MDRSKKRISVAGLRDADPTTLLVLTQDVLTTPLARLDPDTLCDLLALSELSAGLPVALARDLARFRPQMFRELQDLPDGPSVVAWVEELSHVQPERVPASLREVVGRLVGERRAADAVAALASLVERWAEVEPSPVTLRPAPPARNRQKVAEVPRRTVIPPAPASRTGPSRTPSAQVDLRRAEWITEDILARLRNYGASGLKEPVVVAGARHRAPWKDVDEAEVRAVLRKLGRDGRVRQSAGRWFLA